MKILGIHFSYNKKVQTDRNYLTTVKKIEKALNVWITTTLTLKGKIVIFKTLGISKTENNFRKHFYGTLLSLKSIIGHPVIHM